MEELIQRVGSLAVIDKETKRNDIRNIARTFIIQTPRSEFASPCGTRWAHGAQFRSAENLKPISSFDDWRTICQQATSLLINELRLK